MSARAVDHHHDRPFSSSLDPSSSCSSSTSDIPLETLPQTTYSPSRAPLSLDTLNVDGLRHSFRDSSSPDPREFYLQYRNPFGCDGAGSFDSDSNSNSNSNRAFRSPSVSTIRTRDPGSPSDSRHDQSPSSQRAARQRQVSNNFKSLLNKFGATQDEVIPRPPGSIGSSRAPSPSPFSRSRTRSQLNRVTSNGYPESRTRNDIFSVPPNDSSPISPTQTVTATANKRPLFGEILPPAHNRKRSESDGNMRTLEPLMAEMPVDVSRRLDSSSPTAWYLGFTPSLDRVDTTARRAGHKRSRSDLGGITSMTAAMTSPKGSNNPKSTSQSRLPVPARRTSHTSDTASSTPSTRPNSALDRHTPLSPPKVPRPPKGTSALPVLSPKSPSRQFRNDSAKSPVRLGVTSPPRRQRGTGQRGNLDIPKSPSLNAYISAPPQKQSPALRSSRPRQPVSSASTAASRAKVVDKPGKISDRISSLNSAHSTRKPETFRSTKKTSRLLPELKDVDFKARRQQIEAAVKQGVEEENEKQEKKAVLKRAKELEQKQKERGEEDLRLKKLETKTNDETQHDLQQSPVDQHQPGSPAMAGHSQKVTFANKSESNVRCSTPHSPDLGDEHFVTPEEGRSPCIEDSLDDDYKSAPNGFIAQAISGPESPFSPTDAIVPFALVVPQMQVSSQQSTDPASAVTDTTVFDTEEQSDYPTQPAHRTMLSQIMQMRESTPSHSSLEDDDMSFEREDNDQDSIRAMLRRSGYFGRGFDTSSEHDDQDQEDQTDDFDYSRFGAEHRGWDLESWTSSVRRQPTRQDSNEHAAGDSSFSEVNDHNRESVSSTQQLLPTRYDPNEAYVNRESEVEAGPSHRNARNSFISNTDIAQQYPDLMKQAGWDSKRATQLYLQELGFDSSRFSTVEPEKSNQEAAHPNQTNEVTSDGLADDAVMVPESRNVPNSDYTQHRASLNIRDDWEQASTSIVDWMQHAAAEEMVRKDRESKNVETTVPEREGALTPMPLVGTELGKADGLGVSIHVQPPEEVDSPTIPPPVPNHDPPPPPPPKDHLPVAQRSPSIYSSRPQTSILPAPYQDGDSAIGPDLRLYDTRHSAIGPDLRLYSTNESAIGPDLRLSEDAGLTATTSNSNSTAQQDDDHPPPPPQKTPSPEERRLRKRANVMKELIDTEYNFCRDMAVVVDIYKGTSNSCGGLTGDDIRVLFSNSDKVEEFSKTFLEVLKDAARAVYVLSRDQLWMVQRDGNNAEVEHIQAQQQHAKPVFDDGKDRETFVGGAFLAHIENMGRVYADYLKNHDVANKKLQTLLKNKVVAIWLIECGRWASDLTTAWNLDALLVKPVQRITKYPLLLTELLSATPSDHPDHGAIANALREVTSISHRINEMKKRADVVTQVISRKRKESDVRMGLSKVLGRQAGKLKQHVGLAETVDDKAYEDLTTRFSENFFQIQIHMRDVEDYIGATHKFVERFGEYAASIEGFVQIAPTNYPELESKWCQFVLAVKDLLTVALPEHVSAVRKHAIDPMITLLKLHDGPQQIMQKRNDRQYAFLKMKAVESRGDEPTKKTKLQGTQFIALDETLKDELPKLISLTGKLMESCLHNYVQLQKEWHTVIQMRLGSILDRAPQDISQIITEWSGDFDISETQVLSLGICNGSVLADTANINNFGSPSEPKVSTASSRRPSTVNSIARGFSTEINGSPKMSLDIGNRVTNSFAQSQFAMSTPPQEPASSGSDRVRPSFETRGRASSTVTGRSEINSFVSLFNSSSRNTTVSTASTPGNDNAAVSTSFRSTSEDSPSLPALSLGNPGLEGENWLKPYLPENPPDPNEHPSSPAVAVRYSTLFSSAMPMSSENTPTSATATNDTLSNNVAPAPAPTSAPAPVPTPDEGPVYMDLETLNRRDSAPAPSGRWQRPRYCVLFVAASLFDFHIDPPRHEAGFPYHTYNPGEVFDVVASKGDLWMARNQDDPRGIIGWIWSKHFKNVG